jgi:hypothetical protein
LGADTSTLISFIIHGQTAYRMVYVTTKTYKIQKYNWETLAWEDFGENFVLNGAGYTGSGYLWGMFGGKFVIAATSSGEYSGGWHLFDGKTLSSRLQVYSNNYPVIHDNKLYITWGSRTVVYNADGTLSGSYTQSIDTHNAVGGCVPISNGTDLYLFQVYASAAGVGQTNQYVYKWNDTSHEWEKIYQSEQNLFLPYVQYAFVYKNKIYAIHTAYMTGSNYHPVYISEFDTSDNQIYLKGYLANADWKLAGTRASAANKSKVTSVTMINSQIYAYGSNFLKCLNPFIDCSKKEILYENEV